MLIVHCIYACNNSRLHRTMDSFDMLSSESEEGLLDEIVVGSNYNQQQLQRMQCYQLQQLPPYVKHYQSSQQLQQQQPQQTIAAVAYQNKQYYYDAIESPIHYCDTAEHSDDNSTQENLPPNYQILPTTQQQQQYHHNVDNGSSNFTASLLETKARDMAKVTVAITTATTTVKTVNEPTDTIKAAAAYIQYACNEVDTKSSKCQSLEMQPLNYIAPQASSSHATNWGTNGHNQLTADMCNYKNSKSRRLEYSLKCLKYGRSNPSQDSAFGSLTDNDLSTGSFRLSSFQSISSPIDEGVEDIIIATTTAGKETCLELATIPRSMVSQDSAISSPCRESSPNNFLHIDDAMLSGNCSGNSSSSSSTGNIRPQQFPVSLSPKILVTATTNSSNSSLSSINVPVPTPTQQHQQQQPPQQFEPPKILVNDQNSIYTTSPSKRTSTIEVFSQKYRVSSFEDMSPSRRAAEKHLRNVNRLAFRSLEEERRIDSAFMPISERTHSENRVNLQNEKYKKLTHASFRISKTASQLTMFDSSPRHSLAGSREHVMNEAIIGMDMQRPATVTGSSSSRQTMWRISKFYRKNRIAKSNDSLLETSLNNSMRLSPASLHDNHYESCSSVGSRQSLNHGSSINEIYGSPQQSLNNMHGLSVTTSFNGLAHGRRYCSSKSEELADTHDYLSVMDARKSYSERHLVTLTKLRQTAINNSTPEGSNEQCYLSEDDTSFNDDNNAYGYQQQQKQYAQRTHHYNVTHQQQSQQQQQHNVQQRAHPNQFSWSSCSINRLKTTNIKTTSLATLSCQKNLSSKAASASVSTNSSYSGLSGAELKPHANPVNINFLAMEPNSNNTDSSGGSCLSCIYTVNSAEDANSSNDTSPLRQSLSGVELARIFALEAQRSSCSEEKTPLLDSVELSPLSPSDGDSEHGETM